MLDHFDIRTNDMPIEMQSLLRDYPRDDWDAHPGFKEKTRHWLGADYANRLAYRGNALVGNLHGHHGWEDHSYFPELSAADPRFNAGLDILEKDHEDLDGVLDNFTQTANRTIKLVQLDEKEAREDAGKLHGVAQTIEAFLDRHLSDEEELAVPIILHHRLRG